MHRFIIGTGRCGSTLLSKMIRENKQVVSIFEYFSGLDPERCFAREPLDGESFAGMHCRVDTITNEVLVRGYPIAEVAYPFDAPGRRYSREGDLPSIMGATIPSLPVEDIDAFYDSARAFMLAQPPGPASAHHRAFFNWIAQRLGKAVWVERSGGSIGYVGQLNAMFPAARFVHIHRLGQEVALSMREHNVFRLGISLMYELPVTPPATDKISALLESRPPSEYFGRAWTDQLLRGFQALAKLDADQYLEVRFEDLLARPRPVLAEIAEFLDLPDFGGSWLDAGAALVRGVPATRADSLASAERERLDEACRAGNVLLGRA